MIDGAFLQGSSGDSDSNVYDEEWHLCEGLLNIYLKGSGARKILFKNQLDTTNNSASVLMTAGNERHANEDEFAALVRGKSSNVRD